MKKIFWAFLFFSWATSIQAQDKFWIILKDKPHYKTKNYVSPHTEANRKLLRLPVYQLSDGPVFQPYIDSLKSEGVTPVCTSKWLNAVSAYLDKEQIHQVSQLPFVQEILPINIQITPARQAVIDFVPEDYTTVMNQVGADAFVNEGLTGKDILIGVIDVGFYGLTSSKFLQHLVENNKIKGAKDYITPNKTDHFGDLETSADYHGSMVLQMIAGYNQEKKQQHGMATGATFLLARTDHGTKETRSEEENWIEAMEYMDSLGVRLINTSLGYALGFTNPKENYKPSQMTGNTSIISKATHIAYEEKGMLLVVSAGNEGNDPNWRIVSTPADSKSVLSVGATDIRNRSKMNYSSIGPHFLPYLKPNVSCYSSAGTSFSAPVITGFAACLMEKDSTLTNKQLMQIIQKSAHLYPYGNNFIGYGIPNAAKALAIVKDSTLLPHIIQEVRQEGNHFRMEVELSPSEKAIVFHKRKGFYVLKQEVVSLKKKLLEVKRLPHENRTTIDLSNKIIEVYWTNF